MKRWCTFICVLVIVAACLSLEPSSALADGGRMATDLVVVLDESKSMHSIHGGGSDVNGYRLDATAIILSMLDIENSNAAVVMFAKEIFTKDNLFLATDAEKQALSWLNTLFPMSNLAQRTAAINSIENNRKKLNTGRYGGAEAKTHEDGFLDNDTDIGKALLKAVNILTESNSGNEKAVLLLTDGNIDIRRDGDGKSVDPVKEEASRKNVETAINQAKQKGITIHTASLLSEAGSTVPPIMQDISSRTRGSHFVVTNASDLTSIFNSIFASQIGSNLVVVKSNEIKNDDKREKNYSKIEMDVPNKSVREINLVISKPDGKSTDTKNFKIFDPSGKEIAPDNRTLLKTETSYFLSYKIINPSPSSASGKWRFSFPRGAANNMSLQYVFSYNVDAKVELSANTQAKQKPLEISAYFTENGVDSMDDTLYGSIEATMTIYSEDNSGTVVKKVKMTVDKSGAAPRYFYKLSPKEDLGKFYGKGNFSVVVDFEGAGMKRTSRPVSFTLTNDAPVISKNLEDMSFIFNDHNTGEVTPEKEVALRQYVTDPNGDELTFELKDILTALNVHLEDGVLRIAQREQASDVPVTIIAKDGDGGQVEIKQSVHVIDKDDQYSAYRLQIGIDGLSEDGTSGVWPLRKGQTYTVRVTPMGENNAVTKESLYDLQVVKDHTTITMTRQNDGSYTGSFTAETQKTQYPVSASAKFGSSEHGTLKSVTMNARVENSSPVKSTVFIEGKLSEQLQPSGGMLATLFQKPEGNIFWTQKMLMDAPTDSITFDLSEFFTDPDGKAETLVYSAKVNDEEWPLEDGKILTIREQDLKRLNNFTYTINIACTDNDLEEANDSTSFMTASLKVRERRNLFILAVSLVSLIVLFLIIRYILKPFYQRNKKLHLYVNDIPQLSEKPLPARGFARKRKLLLSHFHDVEIERQTNDNITIQLLRAVTISPARNGKLNVELGKKAPSRLKVSVGGRELDRKYRKGKLSMYQDLVLWTEDAPYAKVAFKLEDREQNSGATI